MQPETAAAGHYSVGRTFMGFPQHLGVTRTLETVNVQHRQPPVVEAEEIHRLLKEGIKMARGTVGRIPL